ncbi:hypothetical protein [Streptomyces sp. NBC_00271]|uniref:hypothetical protein n=1 Tax=Streptomyces sp. NBC_00271 TaxID=2975697 RepID=UPI002E2AD9C2|nr:hypothetical protein [Streptomyces sp. NBC_00271]
MHSHTTDEGAPSASALEDPLAAARALIAHEQQARMEACAAELQQVLEKHGMRLDVAQPQISIVPA